MYVFPLILVGMAAHSKSSQSFPCKWVVEALARRKSVFLASSAVFLQRDPGKLLPDQLISEEVTWAHGDSLLIHTWVWQHGRR